MLTCINKNSAEYQTLKERSGISDFMLEAICRDFLDKYDRFPYLDEIIGSNSDPHIRKSLQLDSYNSTNIDNILSITGASTIELANISLNDLYRDVEVEITPLNKDAIVEITKRPTEDNFDNWTEEDEILSKAPRNSDGLLLAPNGNISNLAKNEKQYAQVRTKAFKKWFGDWESSEFINKIDNIEKRITDDMEWSDIVDMLVNEGILEKGYWGILGREIVMANINGVKIPFYRSNNGTSNKKAGKWYQFFGFGNADSSSKSNDWFIKGSNKNNNEIENGYGSIDIQRLTKLFNDYLNWTGKHDDTMNMHSVYDFTEKGIDGGIHFHLGEERTDDINEILYGNKNISLTGNGARKALDERIQKIKNNSKNNASKVVDENGEPLVVYHGTNIENISIFDRTQIPEEQTLVGTGTATFGNFFSDKKDDAKSFADITRLRRNRGKATVYDTFLSIKNPMYFETLGDFRDYSYKEGHYNENGDFVSDVKLPKEYDGIIVKRRNSRDDTKEFVAPNSNQIKSATNNSGLFSRQNNNIYDPEPNGYLVFTNALNKLASLYGIKFNDITNAELNSEEWKSIIPDVNSVNAFVYNGQIYINIDKANLDAPIHEMMHILVGSIRFLNPNLYTELISLAEQFPNYSKLILKFQGRTRNDINEEIFIEEVSKYLSGLPSNIANITPKLLYEISYNIKRLLDTILMGEDSVKTLSNDRLFSLSLKELALEVNSSIMKNNFHGTINVENSELHRKLNNIKSDLYNLGTLKEYCD